MNEIFTNEEGKSLVTEINEYPSMSGGEFGDQGGIFYCFYLIDFKTITMKKVTEEEVFSFYKGLKRRHTRIGLYYCMRENGWVGKRQEFDPYEYDHAHGRKANQ